MLAFLVGLAVGLASRVCARFSSKPSVSAADFTEDRGTKIGSV